jgi:DNA-binding MarR family transcriptional regulator
MSDTVVATDPAAARPAAIADGGDLSVPNRIAGVSAVADNFINLMRTFTRAKARMLQNVENDFEWATNVLLRSLALDGPMRSSTLAETVQSDPSTVSRQVAALVRDGLIERQADPVDGRASLLVLSEAGRVVVAEHDRRRVAHFDRMVADWTTDELSQFAKLLARFADGYEHVNNAWIAERIARRTAQPGGNPR